MQGFRSTRPYICADGVIVIENFTIIGIVIAASYFQFPLGIPQSGLLARVRFSRSEKVSDTTAAKFDLMWCII